MTTIRQANHEAIEIYAAIKQVMKEMNCDFCQSWWINSKNFSLKSGLSTAKINQRCKLLVKQGYLTIDKSKTSTSTGVCYRLTDKTL